LKGAKRQSLQDFFLKLSFSPDDSSAELSEAAVARLGFSLIVNFEWSIKPFNVRDIYIFRCGKREKEAKAA